MNIGNGLNAPAGSAGPSSDFDRNEGFNSVQHAYSTSPQNQADGSGEQESASPGVKRKKDGTAKRRKVNHACLYCRRSHMTCDEGRPCQRCIKRDIGHLCHDEPKSKHGTDADLHSENLASPQTIQTRQSATPENSLTTNPSMVRLPQNANFNFTPTDSNAASWPISFPPDQAMGNEFSVISDFLESLGDQSFVGNNPGAMNPFPHVAQGVQDFSSNGSVATFQPSEPNSAISSTFPPAQIPQFSDLSAAPQSTPPNRPPSRSRQPSEHVEVLLAPTKAEKFFLTAADQEDGTRDERLTRVIHAKYEAGLLRPFNYVKGYARLSRWMDKNVSPQSKQLILQPLSVVRPKFRAIAQSLTDIDLVFIEEAFERLLLDYDRVFSAMGIPACLWRRTGEIYKGNKEFADLIGVDVTQLRDGRLCIYELMTEESAVNYWEKYGHVAFDTAQKAVLTSCVLRYKPSPATLSYYPPTSPTITASSVASIGPASPTGKKLPKTRPTPGPLEEGLMSCCFSFTIQRDLHGIPTLIAGNFIQH